MCESAFELYQGEEYTASIPDAVASIVRVLRTRIGKPWTRLSQGAREQIRTAYDWQWKAAPASFYTDADIPFGNPKEELFPKQFFTVIGNIQTRPFLRR